MTPKFKVAYLLLFSFVLGSSVLAQNPEGGQSRGAIRWDYAKEIIRDYINTHYPNEFDTTMVNRVGELVQVIREYRLWEYFGTENLTDMSDLEIIAHCLVEAIRTVTRRGITPIEAAGEITALIDSVKINYWSRGVFWQKVIDCPGFCPPLMDGVSLCMLRAYKDYFIGPILFNFRDTTYRDITERDTVNHPDIVSGETVSIVEPYFNKPVIDSAVAVWSRDTRQIVYLEGSSSAIGDSASEVDRSRGRVNSVRQALTERGVNITSIDSRFLGSHPPQIDAVSAEILNILDIYRAYGNWSCNQSVLIFIYRPQERRQR